MIDRLEAPWIDMSMSDRASECLRFDLDLKGFATAVTCLNDHTIYDIGCAAKDRAGIAARFAQAEAEDCQEFASTLEVHFRDFAPVERKRRRAVQAQMRRYDARLREAVPS